MRGMARRSTVTLQYRRSPIPNLAIDLDAVRESGLPVKSQPGIAQAAVENGLFRCEVLAGSYRFTTRLPAK